jgi:hypothetical protein
LSVADVRVQHGIKKEYGSELGLNFRCAEVANIGKAGRGMREKEGGLGGVNEGRYGGL